MTTWPSYSKTIILLFICFHSQAQLLDIGKKQNHQELASLVDSAIVTDLYQRLKAGMSKEKQQKVVFADDIVTTEIEEGEQGAQEGGPPEVGANEVLITEVENKRPFEDGHESEEERDCKRIKYEETDEVDLNEIIENVSKDLSNDVTLSNDIRNKMVASVLLSLNGETQTT